MLSKAKLLVTMLYFMCSHGGCANSSSETEAETVRSITYEDVLQNAVLHAKTQLNWEFAVAAPNIVLHDGRALVRVYLSPTIEEIDDWTHYAVISIDFGGEVTNVAEANF